MGRDGGDGFHSQLSDDYVCVRVFLKSNFEKKMKFLSNFVGLLTISDLYVQREMTVIGARAYVLLLLCYFTLLPGMK